MIDYQGLFEELRQRVGKEEATNVLNAGISDTAMSALYLAGKPGVKSETLVVLADLFDEAIATEHAEEGKTGLSPKDQI